MSTVAVDFDASSNVKPKVYGKAFRPYSPDGTQYRGWKTVNGGGNYDAQLPTSLPGAKTTLRMNTDGTIICEDEGGSSGANTALSNLASVAVNADIDPGSDAARSFGDSSHRYVEFNYATGLFGWASSGDAQPATKVLVGSLQFGAGGGSAVDCSLSRGAAGVMTLDCILRPTSYGGQSLGDGTAPWGSAYFNYAGGVYFHKSGTGEIGRINAGTFHIDVDQQTGGGGGVVRFVSSSDEVSSTVAVKIDNGGGYASRLGFGSDLTKTYINKSANSGGNFDRARDGVVFERMDGSRVGLLASLRTGPDSAIGTALGVFYTTMYTSAADTTVANTTTPTSLLDTGVGTRTIPASYVRVGSRFRMRLVGRLSTKTVAPGNITFDVKIGTVVIATTTVAITGALSDSKFELECEFIVRATGSSGNVMAWGEVQNQIAAFAADLSYAMTNTAVSSAINFTLINVFNCLVTFATADVANTITIQCATVEVAN